MSDDFVYYATVEERAEFRHLTAGLPETEIGLSAHSLFAVKAIVATVKPKRVLEIGFDRGSSSAMWLGLSDASVVSIDISDDPELHRAVAVLQNRYPGRLEFIRSDSTKVEIDPRLHQFDMAFIDGDHTEDGALSDLMMVKSLNIQWVVLDDWLEDFGPGVAIAAERAGFEPFAIFKRNIALGRFVLSRHHELA